MLALLLVARAAHWHTFGVSELGQDGFLSAGPAWGPLLIWSATAAIA